MLPPLILSPCKLILYAIKTVGNHITVLLNRFLTVRGINREELLVPNTSGKKTGCAMGAQVINPEPRDLTGATEFTAGLFTSFARR